MKKILIVGTGALATLFAARLAAAGVGITILGTWEQAIQAFNREGARLSLPDGSTLQVGVRATNDLRVIEKIDLALVLVKSWQTARAASMLAEVLAVDGLALTLQNGLGNRETLAASLGEQRVALGVTTTGATLLGPGQARVGGEGSVSLERHPRSREVSELLQAAGMRVDVVPDANALLWGKLVVNAAINPLTAILRVTNGVLLERPSARRLMASLARETAAVASALQIKLPFNDPVEMAEDVARRTAANRSSMLQDVERAAPTEIDAICGAVVRTGAERGVPAPVNWTMWQLVNALNSA
ncbi:MAG TPA: 2-dehydropantoate 2-reductase [Anaerolineales bacterium]